MEDDYTTNSHFLIDVFLFKKLGKCTFWTWCMDSPSMELYTQALYNNNIAKL